LLPGRKGSIHCVGINTRESKKEERWQCTEILDFDAIRKQSNDAIESHKERE
jgi:hypothetical protein